MCVLCVACWSNCSNWKIVFEDKRDYRLKVRTAGTTRRDSTPNHEMARWLLVVHAKSGCKRLYRSGAKEMVKRQIQRGSVRTYGLCTNWVPRPYRLFIPSQTNPFETA